jgi:hypothetical protein
MYSFATSNADCALELAAKQSDRMDISHEEADLDIDDEANDDSRANDLTDSTPECFANQKVYARPSAYISHLLAQLPTDKS